MACKTKVRFGKNMYIGDKVRVKDRYILEIAKKDFELAKSLVGVIGEIVMFDDITWHFIVRFDNKEYSVRHYQIEKADGAVVKS